MLGVAIFALVMTGFFYAIFAFAALPMDLLELVFSHLGAVIGATLPAGPIHDFVDAGHDLLLTLGQAMGLETDEFNGASTGTVTGLLA